MQDLTNKKLLKEWKKIETAKIFSDLEEFADFYYANGEKSCFRIITSAPWSKDNFFFGDYSALLDYYKYEFPKRRVGQKFHSLTILDIFYKNVNGKESLYAKCKCDCGNETEKLLDSIIKGNARTCGCKKKQSKDKGIGTSLYDLFPSIVDKYWDYSKNQMLPQDISITSQEEYWWKGYKHSYKMPLSPLLKKKTGTSFPEQAIFFFLKQNNIEVLNRHRIKYNKKNYEIDVFLPQYNIGIEYDGVMWHESKQNLEHEKNVATEKAGVFLIRIREEGLLPTNLNKGEEIFIDSGEGKKALVKAINELFCLLEKNVGCKLKKIDYQELENNKLLIYGQYLFSYNEDCISNSPLISFWSKDNGVEPYLVSVKSTDVFVFECACGKKFNTTPKKLYFWTNTKNKHNNCLLNMAGVCDKYNILPEGLIVQKGLYDDNLSTYCKLQFLLENHYNIWWQSLQPKNYYIIDKQGDFYISNERIGNAQIKVSQLENPIYSKCLVNLFSYGDPDLSVPPYSKIQYEFKIYNPTKDSRNFNMIIENEILDSENWIYKVIIAIKKEKNKIAIRCKTFSLKELSRILWNDKWAYKHFSNKQKFNKFEVVELLNFLFPEEKIQQVVQPMEMYAKALELYARGERKAVFNQSQIKAGTIVVHNELKEGKITKVISPKAVEVSFPIIDVVFSISSFQDGTVKIKGDIPTIEVFDNVYKRVEESYK